MLKFYSALLKLPFIIILNLAISHAQTWLQPHSQLNLANHPSQTTLGQIIATNGGNQMGNQGIPNPGVINTLRDFYHMEIDYNYSYFPSEGTLNANTCDCSNVWCNNGNCNNFINNPGGQSSFTSKKDFYCSWNGPNFQFGEVYSTMEALFIKSTSIGGCANADITRGFPDKWYSLAEWGGIGNIRQNYINYLLPWLETYCPNDPNKPCLIDVLEVGNEPWGDPYPGRDGYHQLMSAAVAAFTQHFGSANPSNWRMKLSTAAFEAHDDNPNNFGATEQYVGDMLPDSLLPYYDYVTIHPYAFPLNGSSFSVDQRPEAEGGAFLTFKNLIEWRNQKMPHAEVNITEFGWNAGLPNDGCGPFGESTQSAYIMRSFLLAQRYGVHRAFVYSIDDSHEFPLYCTIGLYQDLHNNNPRKIMESILKLKSSDLSDKVFLKALHEDADEANNGLNGKYVYILGDASGQPTHLVAWRPDALNYEDSNYPSVSNAFETIQLPDTTIWAKSNDQYWYLGWDNSNDNTIGQNAQTNVNLNQDSSSTIDIKLSAVPVVIPLYTNSCQYDAQGNLINCNGLITVNEDISASEVRLSVYPNPASQELNVEWFGAGKLTFRNALGQLIFRKDYQETSIRTALDISGLSPGIYHLNLSTDFGQVSRKVIIEK
ncbi:MAG: T9SS type A sorting domain-containing protein [Flavobacteriales bacterium]|nr:T9SS type A sorting domain-containing protein [Flavobacteriales bacterium]